MRRGKGLPRAALLSVVAVAAIVVGPAPAAQGKMTLREAVQAYQPIASVDKDDGFWPMRFERVFEFEGDTGLVDGGVPKDQTKHTAIDGDDDLSAELSNLKANQGKGQNLDWPARIDNPGRQKEMLEDAIGKCESSCDSSAYYITTSGFSTDEIVIQYWYFFSYNHQELDFSHEGDWEMSAVGIDRDSRRAKYLLTYPHGKLKRYSWRSKGVKKRGTHPFIYAARDGHGWYPTCGSMRVRPPVATRPARATCSSSTRGNRCTACVAAPGRCWEGRVGEGGGPLCRASRASRRSSGARRSSADSVRPWTPCPTGRPAPPRSCAWPARMRSRCRPPSVPVTAACCWHSAASGRRYGACAITTPPPRCA